MSQSHEFIRFAVESGVLKFGDFKTKAGRISPYFFNAGLFNDGRSLGRLAVFYAERLLQAEREEGTAPFDMLYGPAYKGIALASSMAVALAARGRNLPFAFNRKEAKDHGEGGNIVGAMLKGRILVVDDVITAGTSVRESMEIIRAAGATPAGVLIAVDRQERGKGELSAAQEVSRDYGLRVSAIATLEDILANLGGRPEQTPNLERIEDYRRRYGAPA